MMTFLAGNVLVLAVISGYVLRLVIQQRRLVRVWAEVKATASHEVESSGRRAA